MGQGLQDMVKKALDALNYNPGGMTSNMPRSLTGPPLFGAQAPVREKVPPSVVVSNIGIKKNPDIPTSKPMTQIPGLPPPDLSFLPKANNLPASTQPYVAPAGMNKPARSPSPNRQPTKAMGGLAPTPPELYESNPPDYPSVSAPSISQPALTREQEVQQRVDKHFGVGENITDPNYVEQIMGPTRERPATTWANKAEWHVNGPMGLKRAQADENLRVAMKLGNQKEIKSAADTIESLEKGMTEAEKANWSGRREQAEVAYKGGLTRQAEAAGEHYTAEAGKTREETKYIGKKTEAEIRELNSRAAAHGIPGARLAWDIKQADTNGVFKDPLKAIKFISELGRETVTEEDPETMRKVTSVRPNIKVGIQAMKDMGYGHMLSKELLNQISAPVESPPVSAFVKGKEFVKGSNGSVWRLPPGTKVPVMVKEGNLLGGK